MKIESGFKDELRTITADTKLIEFLWDEIRTEYSASGRYYHDLSHLENIFEQLLQLRSKITDMRIVLFSIVYHDIVYDPSEQNNEERSADIAVERLTMLNIPLLQIQKCKEQIMATKAHQLCTDPDTNYFTDADLSILGSQPSVYRQYSQAIRKEYGIFPETVYNSGRKKVLKYFLGLPRLFKTTYFFEKFEKDARENIMNELIEIK